MTGLTLSNSDLHRSVMPRARALDGEGGESGCHIRLGKEAVFSSSKPRG